MASVTKDSKGWRVEFTLPGQRRRQLRLGKKISEKAARDIGRHVERIIESRKTGLPVAGETEKWVLGLSDQLRERLVSLGLIADAGRRPSRSLGGFLEEYLKGRTDLEPGSISNMATARRWLEKYFGVDRDMESITPGDADSYRIWLRTTGNQAENTTRRLCSRARQFFRAAYRQRLITENPFGEMKKLAVGPSPEERIEFIDRTIAKRVLEACPDDEWRAIFGLLRFGGLRCPSEITPLRWSDIDWLKGEIMLNCIKTKHHDGREFRVIPLFPELRVLLETWRATAPVESEWVIDRVRSRKTNLRTQLTRIIKAAGLTPWPKLIQNLRTSRETELSEEFPIHVVCAWMGNTPKVAAKHYLQVTREHFDKARAPVNGAA